MQVVITRASEFSRHRATNTRLTATQRYTRRLLLLQLRAKPQLVLVPPARQRNRTLLPRSMREIPHHGQIRAQHGY